VKYFLTQVIKRD